MYQLMSMLHADTPRDLMWIMFGLFGQLMFTGRFIVQWLASEKAKASVIPVAFWLFSLGGGFLLLIYSIARQDPVFIAGQGLGLLIYIRNLMLIRKSTKRTANDQP